MEESERGHVIVDFAFAGCGDAQVCCGRAFKVFVVGQWEVTSSGEVISVHVKVLSEGVDCNRKAAILFEAF